MGQGSINQVQPTKSPLEGILHALQAVHAVYGINTEAAQQKLLDSKSIQQEQENKLGADKVKNLEESKLPTSQKSLYAKANATALVTSLVDRGAIKPETASPLLDFIKKPETSASDLENFNENPQVKLAVADSAERGATAKADAIVKAANVRGAVTQQNVGIRQGNQAAHAADQFLKDPVIKVASNQLQSLDKGLGRFADIRSGKIPFSMQLKSELEKDFVNTLSGGGSGSLGAQQRIEFDPTVAKWNDLFGKLQGKQRDIGAPEYLNQLEEMFNGLKRDIGGIREKRAQFLSDSISPAYKNNPRALETIAANVKTHAAPIVKETAAVTPHPQDQAALEWAKSNPKDPRSAEILRVNGVK